MNILEWLPAIFYGSIAIGLITLAARIFTLEWLPRCPACNARGYREICSLSSKLGEDPLAITDADMNWREIRRCKRCRVYRINGPNGWQDLSWDNWQAEASKVTREDAP